MVTDLHDLSLQELIIQYGEACQEKYWQLDQGYRQREVDRAVAYHRAVVDELAERGFEVPYGDSP